MFPSTVKAKSHLIVHIVASLGFVAQIKVLIQETAFTHLTAITTTGVLFIYSLSFGKNGLSAK
jgi:hypothetical protein